MPRCARVWARHGKRLCVLAIEASHGFFLAFFLKWVREMLKRVVSVSRPHAAINVRFAGSKGANGRRFVGNPVPQALGGGGGGGGGAVSRVSVCD